MAGSSSGAVVAGLTAAAFAAVGFLTYQASAGATDTPIKSRPGHSSADDPHKSAPDRTPGSQARELPSDSGKGLRVVYSLGERRVWLVGRDERPTRTYKVAPSAVSPPPGVYKVTSRSVKVPGSDGVPVEHVVRFAKVGNVYIGFSAAADGSMPDGEPKPGTGGIREPREDGAALWKFATIDRKVVVVA